MRKIPPKLAYYKRLQNKSISDLSVFQYEYIQEYIGQDGVISDEDYRKICIKEIKNLKRKDLLDIFNSYFRDSLMWLNEQAWYDNFGRVDIIKFINPKFKKDKLIALKLLKDYVGSAKYLHKSLLKNKDFIIQLITPDLKKGRSTPSEFHEQFEYVDDSLKSDIKFVIKALKISGRIFPFLSSKMHKRKDVLLSAFKSKLPCDFYMASPYLEKSIFAERSVMLLAAKKTEIFGIGELKKLSKELRGDKEIVLEVLRTSPENFKYASQDLKSDKEICLAACKKSSEQIKHMDKKFLKDLDIALELIKIHFDNFKFIDKSLLKSKQFAKRVINYDGTFIEYFSETIRKDKNIAIESILNDWRSINYIHKSLYRNKDVMKSAIKKNGAAMMYADQSLKKDKKFCLMALKTDSDAFDYIDDSLQKDPKILKAVGKKHN
jgi:hypothetical protein